MASPPPSILILLSLLLLIPNTSPTSLTTLIFKGCASQNFQTPQQQQTTLQTLFITLLTHSPNTLFYKTTINNTITGLYQCRGDLSKQDCNSCVQTLPNLFPTLCNPSTLSARIHLAGCYMWYEVVGFLQVPPDQLLYKKCGSGRDGDGSEFGGKMDVVMGMVVKGVGDKGFWVGGYQGVYGLGQCEGGLGSGECVKCVRKATEIGRSECSGFVSGGVFLQMCWVSYTYYPDGVPGNRDGDVGSEETGATEVDGHGGGGFGVDGRKNTEKTVAIVFGGLAVLLLLVALLLVVKSAFKKKREYYHYGDHHADHHRADNQRDNQRVDHHRADNQRDNSFG